MSSSLAAVPQRFFLNESFEIPDLITAGCRVYINHDLVPGWQTTHPSSLTQAVGCPSFDPGVTGPIIELWKTPRQGVNARSGDQLAELNALISSRLFQAMCIYNGETVTWSLSHRGRGSSSVYDIMNFLVNTQAIKRIRTTNTGTGGFDPAFPGVGSGTSALGPNGWRDYTGSFVYTGTDGIQSVGFEAVSSATGSDEGNFLDAISISVNPLVEFTSTSYTSNEGDTTGGPQIYILGSVPAGGIVVEIEITGGTAILGEDFQTVPPDSTTLFITIPAGEYVTPTAFSLPVVSLSDNVTENDETVTFQIQPNTHYTIGDTVACSSDKFAETTWTIRNVSPILSLEKTGLLNDGNGNGTIDLGETISYSFKVTNTGIVTLTNVTINDPMLIAAGISVSPAPQTLAPGGNVTFTATYTPTQADIDAGGVTNTATARGTPPTGPTVISVPGTVTIGATVNTDARLEIIKGGKFNDLDGDGHASLGDMLSYTFTIKNTGNTVIDDVWPKDDGPTFNGRPAAGHLSTFQPAPVTLQPGGAQAFTATYVLTQDDITNAAGVKDGIVNHASAIGTSNGQSPTSNTSTSTITLPAVVVGDVSIIKQSLLAHIRRGERAPYAIRLTNNTDRDAGLITVVDTLPPGFRYVEGSATVDGTAFTPIVNGLKIRFEHLPLGPRAEVLIRLQALALSSVGPGKYTNRAIAYDRSGRPISPEAKADIEIQAEPVFDCGDIVGKVFDDKNRNGHQDEGEPGLPGVRVATVKGELITTDPYGRFHVACADLPDQRIGSNFILKLDPRTLPASYRITTENPRVIRLTAGKMVNVTFGAALGRIVRLDLRDDAFEADSARLNAQWEKGVDQLISVLAEEASILRINYLTSGAHNDQTQRQRVKDRMDALKKLIMERWRASGETSPLDIEIHTETVR